MAIGKIRNLNNSGGGSNKHYLYKLKEGIDRFADKRWGSSNVVHEPTTDGLKIVVPSGAGAGVYIYTDVSDYNFFVCEVTSIAGSPSSGFIGVGLSTDWGNQATAIETLFSGSAKYAEYPNAKTFTIDISKITGKYQVGVGVWGMSNTTTILIRNIYLAK